MILGPILALGKVESQFRIAVSVLSYPLVIFALTYMGIGRPYLDDISTSNVFTGPD